jgi:small GTP-binding protein
MVDIKRMKKKICLLGDAAVGKTSLIARYVFDQFDDKYLTTLGAKVSKKDVQLNISNGVGTPINVNLTISIWDILGQKDDSSLDVRELYFRGANGAFIVCDITRKDTFDSVPTWVKSFLKVTTDVPIVLIGNKIDLYNQAQVSYDDLSDYSESLQFPLFLTSAKINSGVEQAFQKLSLLMLEKTLSANKDDVDV